MFSFKDHTEEINAISKANNVDTGVAYDMFRTDVRLGENINSGPAMDGFDFAAAKEAWDAMTEAEQKAAYDEWHGRNK